jgi:hypothetical protein
VIFAYADPPYLGCARRYREHPDAFRWDDPAEHGELMATMERDYDGWALSAGMNSLQALLPLAPANVRIAAWVKPFSAAFPTVRIAYAWEPVIYRPARPLTKDGAPSIKDFLRENMAMRRETIGAKPERFCRWVLDLLGYIDGDEMVDLFPGTGVMTQVTRQTVLPLHQAAM